MKVTGWAAGAVAVLVGGVVLGVAAPAQAAPGESISSYDTRIEVRADGRLAVTETIRYDFGAGRQHGIFRKVPARFRYDGTRDRIYPIDGITVTMDGAPVQFIHWAEGGYEVIRAGDPDATVTGTHTYGFGYTVRGALNHFADHEELYWNLIGSEWQVPIETATATVTGPAAIQRWECFAGPAGSHQGCTDPAVSGDSARFHETGLGNGAALTAVLAFPAGSVATGGPILTDRHDLASAFHLTPWTGLGALGLALLTVGAALAVAWRVGRDLRYVGQLPGLVPEPGEPAVERRKSLVGAPPVSVEFVPPDGIRPGQVGTLVDERADVVDVTATIVDFAVRRHLLIREVREPGASRPDDWELVRLTDADPGFLPYESLLFEALFAGRDEVRLSELKGTIHADVQLARERLYTDLVTQGWYRRSPKQVRATARIRAFLLLLGTVAVTVVLAFTTHLALLGLGLVAGAVTLLALAGRFPARTGRGSAMLERVRGLRLYIATAEADQLRFQEREQIFSRYLPYAMVFGLTGRWTRVFGGIGAPGMEGGAVGAGGLYWYSGLAWGQPGFASTMDSFTSTAIGSVGAAPPSAAGASGLSSSGFSGGFSGGGGGGGGGGSW